ncbi:MAG TPA: TetR/AcrR family transcriptional regulator [Nocardioidaceae bacterium]|nr:TetR/AcrR family transcriptional regulator [Nocardioidaceae bacterium]
MTQPETTGTRERILAAAATVLSRKGYAGARLSDIAELAELRTPAVYYYFDSREHLISEVMTVGQRSVLEYVTRALDELGAGAGAAVRLDRAVEAHLEVELSQSDFATAVTRNVGQLPEELQEGFRADGHRYFAVWDGLLAELDAEGLLAPGLDRRAARMLVLGALNWTAEWWDPAHGDFLDLVETARRMARGALTASHPLHPSLI